LERLNSISQSKKYEKQDQQGKAAFNERNPHMTQQQKPTFLTDRFADVRSVLLQYRLQTGKT
jgi:hypothetical protein